MVKPKHTTAGKLEQLPCSARLFARTCLLLIHHLLLQDCSLRQPDLNAVKNIEKLGKYWTLSGISEELGLFISAYIQDKST